MKYVSSLNYKRFVFVKALKFYIYNCFITYVPSYTLRNFYLRKILGIVIGKKSAIHFGCFFAGSNITIGNNCVINRKCYLDGRSGQIEIKNNVNISFECVLLTVSHDVKSPDFVSVSGKITIHDHSWLGIRSIILPNVEIGEGAVVAANSVVNKSVESYHIVGGVPAKKIGDRPAHITYTSNYFPLFNTDYSL